MKCLLTHCVYCMSQSFRFRFGKKDFALIFIASCSGFKPATKNQNLLTHNTFLFNSTKRCCYDLCNNCKRCLKWLRGPRRPLTNPSQVLTLVPTCEVSPSSRLPLEALGQTHLSAETLTIKNAPKL